MALPDQKKRLLKAKIAVALQNELGRVPTEEEINNIFLTVRVCIKQSLDSISPDSNKRKAASSLFSKCSTILYMLIGYARVSTQDQTLNLQLDALKTIGVSRIFTDTASGAKEERKGLEEALEFAREGDTLVVWRLDRLGRSLKHLIETVTRLNNRKIGFKSLQENIDTTTSGGKLIFHIFGALAEFERDIIRERTKAGLEAARARGRTGGRPKAKSLDTSKKVAIAQALYNDKTNSIDDICKTLNISRATLYHYIQTGKKAA